MHFGTHHRARTKYCCRAPWISRQLQAERDEIFAKFESSIHDVQQKSGVKSLLLEKKMQILEEKLEKKVTYSNQLHVFDSLECFATSEIVYKLSCSIEKIRINGCSQN